MSTLYELVEWENLGFNVPHSLPYASTKTIAEAVSNIRSVATFVVAVENGVRRPLTNAEESEFQSAYRDHMSRMQSSAAKLQLNCREQAWLLKNPSFLPNGQNLGGTKCLEN
jgi:hypothetical protein